MKAYLEWRRNFMVSNPNLSGFIAFLKGVILTIVYYKYFR